MERGDTQILNLSSALSSLGDLAPAFQGESRKKEGEERKGRIGGEN